MYTQYFKLILSSILRFEGARLESVKQKNLWKDFIAEVRCAAYEAVAESDAFNPHLAFQKANRIKKEFLDAMIGKRHLHNLKPPASLTRQDEYALQTIEVLYIAGGAKAIYNYLPCAGEKYPREIAKNCSLAFGYKTPEGQKKDSNTIRYTEERKRFCAYLAAGYSVRYTLTGSVYLQKDYKKVRFSGHTGIDLLQKDIDEFFYIGHIPEPKQAKERA